MSDVEIQSNHDVTQADRRAAQDPTSVTRNKIKSLLRVLRFLITLATVGLACVVGRMTWNAYMDTPWTRDGTVRAYVVTIAPEVAGRITELPVADNQFVRKGDILMEIDPRDYTIAVKIAEAAVAQAAADVQNKQAEFARRQQLTTLSTSIETKQIYGSAAAMAQANLQRALANLDQARVNLERAQIRSPVNGYVTNLLAQLGDYANVGQIKISVVDADSFWVDGYFEESKLRAIQPGESASIKLMGWGQVLHGHVDSIARGINVANAQPDQAGLASVNPIFTWVRLAQRVPVRIRIDQVPDGVRLIQGMTATVEVHHDE
jgi:multidrug resistance efflux pump